MSSATLSSTYHTSTRPATAPRPSTTRPLILAEYAEDDRVQPERGGRGTRHFLELDDVLVDSRRRVTEVIVEIA